MLMLQLSRIKGSKVTAQTTMKPWPSWKVFPIQEIIVQNWPSLRGWPNRSMESMAQPAAMPSDGLASRPIWVCKTGRILFETFHPQAAQVADFLIAVAEPVSRPQIIHDSQPSLVSTFPVSSGLMMQHAWLRCCLVTSSVDVQFGTGQAGSATDMSF